jgi:phosphatidylinositol-binding clathrin assembly protein
MSAIDAEQSLAIYKSFCTQTEGVVEYLSIARKLSNLLNVPVPNLRHARIASLTRYQLANDKI